MRTLVEKFQEFHTNNPEVWSLFKRFSAEAKNAGHCHFGAWLVINRIRWETLVRTHGDPFKINNNFASFYARKMMAEFPEYRGFFATRRAAADQMAA